MLEVIPVEGLKEDDDALAADLAAFRNSRRGTTVTPGASQGINDEDSLDPDVVGAQLRKVHVDVWGESEEEEEEQELPVESEQDKQDLERDE